MSSYTGIPTMNETLIAIQKTFKNQDLKMGFVYCLRYNNLLIR